MTMIKTRGKTLMSRVQTRGRKSIGEQAVISCPKSRWSGNTLRGELCSKEVEAPQGAGISLAVLREEGVLGARSLTSVASL